jgi:hypothetical protein
MPKRGGKVHIATTRRHYKGTEYKTTLLRRSYGRCCHWDSGSTSMPSSSRGRAYDGLPTPSSGAPRKCHDAAEKPSSWRCRRLGQLFAGSRLLPSNLGVLIVDQPATAVAAVSRTWRQARKLRSLALTPRRLVRYSIVMTFEQALKDGEPR